MENKVYTLPGSSLSYDLGFSDGVVYCHLIRRIKECRLDQVTKVTVKKPSLGMGDELSFRIYFQENGKEKKFPWIMAKVTTPITGEFLEDLKSRISPQAIWEDLREKGTIDSSGNKSYDLQHLPLGWGGAGLGRGVQIWIYLICFAVLIIPLFYYIPVVINGGYRIYTSNEGIVIRKFRSLFIRWEDISSAEITRVKVTNGNSFSQTEVIKLVIKSKSGKSRKVVMRYDFALPFIEELAEHNVISADVLSQFS